MPNDEKIELITKTTYDQAVDRAINKTASMLLDTGEVDENAIHLLAAAIGVAYKMLRDEIFGDSDND